ncbi:putative mitochondrial processing peptidase alpha subunit [Leptomonas pyrrhocoris]|uniref:Putative mitochondrial processing peptidase alpha subunit n=1 Tax=Leptomonas pyrrhocoris TaxID=157538 RepID=A0A0N0DTZ6_LEPPY|nr:putative mitochondrial processing peptidase alpha subunit [Leptomonas pyrrhocoris]XP_015656588.1 putative mitochondrial processing peptidase alpha subunit [Leptomonas pyrrhocoris]KPA78148.1 putative mitochondrial processing peptidase alpha subunit [Leptomonas pyrrhocoris]KPA78149.1 putative mitochondrial processing peptidase alpha subunit [Leptomonas pyrrhocoris]|eukprot:XP_015656587.1 putative mitochondrial processing peptidase alpha subunit [Leptomonas pyrrhocoris]
MLRASSRLGIYEYKFGQPSLKKAFGTNIVPAVKPRQPSALRSTKLANGVRVVSHDLDGAVTSIGVFADAGPKYDPIATPGLSYVMRFALQTSNMDSSLFQIDRVMRSTGNAYGHGEIGKRYLSWKAEGRRDMWEMPFEMLATGVVAPRFHEADIERFRDTMDNQLEEMRWQNPREYAVDQLETVAFYKEPLGAPRMVPKIANDRCSHKALLDHWAANFLPSRIVIAGVNVPHDALVAAYEKLPYKHSAEAPHHARAASPQLSHANEETQFYPGSHNVEYEARASAMGSMPDMQAEVIAAVGVPTYGREAGAKTYAAALVTREVYDEAVRAVYGSRGSPNYYGVQVFYRPYSSAGLIGYTLRGAPGEVEAMIKTAASAFPASVEDAAVQRGVHCAHVRLLHEQTEMVRDYCDFIATSPYGVGELTQAIAAVTKVDVEETLKKMLAKAPSMYATGDTFSFPLVPALNRH